MKKTMATVKVSSGDRRSGPAVLPTSWKPVEADKLVCMPVQASGDGKSKFLIEVHVANNWVCLELDARAAEAVHGALGRWLSIANLMPGKTSVETSE